MTFAIAAAGTGGHVFPGLAVGEALVAAGISPTDVHFLGGARLEAIEYPAAGFPFHSFELRGLSRSLTVANLAIPLVVGRAYRGMTRLLRDRDVSVVLGLGGYVTVPAGLAARSVGVPLLLSEQNAEAGMANRLMSRLASRVFGSFPVTAGLASAEWVGNPVRRPIVERTGVTVSAAKTRYGLKESVPTVGVFGGSLGARIINQAIDSLASGWSDYSGPIEILHLAGQRDRREVEAMAASFQDGTVRWTVIGFEPAMEWFYTASDLVVGRAGGAVAELAVTGTPSILVPGRFGSGGHQEENARAFADRGAAVLLPEDQLERLHEVVAEILSDPGRLARMGDAADSLARSDAAEVIARAMMDAHG